eukprot:COSAG05_NODE_17630_length_322_cov_0.690583_1_plen_33_part_01
MQTKNLRYFGVRILYLQILILLLLWLWLLPALL